MDAHLIDSAIFGHGWSTAESLALFAERARLARWVHVLKALAAAQADLGIIPDASARAIDGLDAGSLDPATVGAETRRTSHSAMGLVRELQARLPEQAREHVYYGATVQDVSDTAAALEIRDVGAQSCGGTCGPWRIPCSSWLCAIATPPCWAAPTASRVPQ